MHSATVTLTDPNPPVITGTSGELTQTGVWHKGARPVTVTATDTGGGVGSVGLTVDGVALAGAARVASACDDSFRVPCPLSVSRALSLATTALTDGTHTVAIRVDDAGGATANTTSGTPWQIGVDNNAPAAPIGLALTTPAVTGSQVGLTWTNPAQGAASPVATLMWELVPLDGIPDGQSGEAPATEVAAGPAVNRPGRWRLDAWLRDGAGNANPAAHASVIVDTRPPPMPTELAMAGTPDPATGTWQATVAWSAPDAGAAPISAVATELCDSSGTCITGIVPGSGPGPLTVTGKVGTPGTYTLRARLVDGAGRQGPPREITFTRAAPPAADDSDSDGVPDAVDACPVAAAPGTSNGCPAIVVTPPTPARSMALAVTSARYDAARRTVALTVKPTRWTRRYLMRVRVGSHRGAPRRVTVPAGRRRLLIPVPRGSAKPSRVEWRPAGSQGWTGVAVS